MYGFKTIRSYNKKLYGNEFDVGRYFQRFFDAIYTLNEIDYDKYINDELSITSLDSDETWEKWITTLAGYYSISIRDLNKYYKHIFSLFAKWKKDVRGNELTKFLRKLYVAWGLMIKYHDLTEYHKFITGNMSKKEFEEIMGVSSSLLMWIYENVMKVVYGRNKRSYDKNNAIDTLYKGYLYIFSSKYRHDLYNKDREAYDLFCRVNFNQIKSIIQFLG